MKTAIAKFAKEDAGLNLLKTENNTIVFTQKIPGGQKKEKDNDDHLSKEMKMAIAKSAKEEAGLDLLKRKTTQFCLQINFQVVKKRRRITMITRAMR